MDVVALYALLSRTAHRTRDRTLATWLSTEVGLEQNNNNGV